MSKVEIDEHTNDRLEAISLRQNRSKGAIALAICEKLVTEGGAHRRGVRVKQPRGRIRATA